MILTIDFSKFVLYTVKYICQIPEVEYFSLSKGRTDQVLSIYELLAGTELILLKTKNSSD